MENIFFKLPGLPFLPPPPLLDIPVEILFHTLKSNKLIIEFAWGREGAWQRADYLPEDCLSTGHGSPLELTLAQS